MFTEKGGQGSNEIKEEREDEEETEKWVDGDYKDIWSRRYSIYLSRFTHPADPSLTSQPAPHTHTHKAAGKGLQTHHLHSSISFSAASSLQANPIIPEALKT